MVEIIVDGVLQTGLSISAEAVGVLTPYALNSIDIGRYWTDLGDITGGVPGVVLRGLTSLGNGIAIVVGDNQRVYKSVDYGKTWAVTSAPWGRWDSFYLGNGIVVVLESGGYTRSTDYGTTWGNPTVIAPDAGADFFSGAYLGNGIALMGNSFGNIWRSTDYGANWTKITGILGASLSTNIIDSITNFDNGIVIFTDGSGHIFRSTNYGLNWTDLGIITALPSGMLDSVYLGNKIGLSFDGLGRVYRTVNSGLSWTNYGIRSSTVNKQVGAILGSTYVGNGIVLFGDFNGHVFKSTNFGLTWEDMGRLAISLISRTMCYLGDGIVLIAGNNGHVYRSDTSYRAEENTIGLLPTINALGTFISGNIGAGFIKASISNTNSAITIVGSNAYTMAIDATVGDRTVIIPVPTSSPGRILNIKKIDGTANIVTIATSGGLSGASTGDIDGSPTYVLTVPNQSLTIQSDSKSNYYVI
ncbi:MAG: hypothetical protein O8C67_05155 [Candidatus Methanoperedens sp.]|nr:hypothetical protein [Candidatus Methanoperedens sp.]